jgi:hypothetical protein
MSSDSTTPQDDFDPALSLPHPPSATWTGETIAGYPIHPYASQWPLIEGRQFEELVMSVEEFGIDVPIEMNNGLVTDGRNRLRAVEVLRSRGVDVRVQTVEWQPRENYSIEMHIFIRNGHRRNMTVDQLAVLAIPFLEEIRAGAAARQVASRFRPGTATRPEADPVAQNSPPPTDGLPKPRRSSRDKDAACTAGQLASIANISRHKAAQVVALADSVAAGHTPSSEIDAVARGGKRLRDAIPHSKRKKNPAKPLRPKTMASRAPVDAMFEDLPIAEAAPAITKEELRRRWALFKEPYPITEHREMLRLMTEIVAEDLHQLAPSSL